MSGQTIEVDGLVKDFGGIRAVDHLSFRVEPGRVTGFLGPNGAGKTTTLRCLLGLVAPTAGTATIGGRQYRDVERPEQVVGAALEASGFHPGRTARDHLRVLARAGGCPPERVDAVLAQVGLTDSADRRAGGFSLGMRQRLSLAAALLGDPSVLLLDEPANGLDPEGIAWLRGFLRFLAGEGRTVLVSSHVLVEVQQTVDDVVIIAKGRAVRACSLDELIASTEAHVLVRTPDAEGLAAVLEAGVDGVRPTSVERSAVDSLRVAGIGTALVGRAALHAGLELHELREERSDLEDVFLSLTADDAPATPTQALGGAA